MDNSRFTELILIIAVVGLTLDFADGNCVIGTGSPGTHATENGTTTDGRTFLLKSSSPCCGELSSWNFYANDVGTVALMLMRPFTGDQYKIIAMETFTAGVGLNSVAPGSGTGLQTNDGTHAAPISVKAGDFIAWGADAEEIVMRSATASATGTENVVLHYGTLAAGNDVGFGSNADTAYTYAIGATVTGNTAPTVTGGALSPPISTTDLNTVVWPSIAITDTETAVNALTVTMAPTTDFTLENDGTDWKIRSSTSSLTVGTHELVVTAVDDCDVSASATITVTVQDTALVFDLPMDTVHATPIDDSETVATINLLDYSVTDSGTVTCTVDDTTHFGITDKGSNAFALYLISGSETALDHNDATQLVATITCTDTGGNSISSTYTVDINDVAPVITAGLDSDTTVGDLSTAIGDTISSFTVSDQDDTLTCTDNNGDFAVALQAGSPTVGDQVFEITTTVALDTNVTPLYEVEIVCVDDQGQAVTGTATVTVTSEPPTLIDLPATATGVSEGPVTAAAVAVLHTFTVTDPNDAASITCAFNPTTTLFVIDKISDTEYTISSVEGETYTAPASGSYDFNIDCQDPSGNVVSGNIEIPLTNAPPTFVNLAGASVTISEDDMARTSIFSLTLSDTEEVKCYLEDTTQAPGVLEPIPVSYTAPETVYEIAIHSSVGFNMADSPLSVDITCGDSESTVTETLSIVINDGPPSISNPGGSTTISETSTSVATLKVIDLIAYDSDATCTLADDFGGKFSLTGTTLEKTTSVLDSTEAPYVLDITCDNPDGTGSVTDTFTVNVDNVGPEILNLPDLVTIDEGQELELLLKSLTLSEDAQWCNITGEGPGFDPQTEFSRQFDVTTDVWSIQYRGQVLNGQPLSIPRQGMYELKIQCEDYSGLTGEVKTLYVLVVDNEEPVTSIDGTPVTETVNAKVVEAGDTIHTITATDTEGDDIEWELVSCTPADTCPFDTKLVNDDLEVYATQDLYNAGSPYYILEVRADDPYNQDTKTEYLLVLIEDINKTPNITNLEKADCVEVNENLGANYLFFTIEHDDTDADTFDFQCNYEDALTASLFECDDATGEVRVLQDVSFEDYPELEFHIEVTVWDGYNSSETKTLCVRFGDVNEPPTWDHGTQLFETDEGTNGQEVGCWKMQTSVTDEDRNEEFHYELDCGAEGEGVFHLVTTPVETCVVMSREYDLEHRSGVSPITVPCEVKVTDDEELSTTFDLDIVVNDKDDEKPFPENTVYEWCTNDAAAAKTILVDDDEDILAANRDWTYDLQDAGNSPFSINGFGQIESGDLSSYDVGTYWEFPVVITDKGDNKATALVTMMVCNDPVVTNTNTNTNTANTASSSSSSSSSSDVLMWAIPAAIAGLALLAGLGYLLYRLCRKPKGKMPIRGRMRQMVRRVMVRKKAVAATRKVGVAQGQRVRVVRKNVAQGTMIRGQQQGYTTGTQGPPPNEVPEGPRGPAQRPEPLNDNSSPNSNFPPKENYDNSMANIGSAPLQTTNFWDRNGI